MTIKKVKKTIKKDTTKVSPKSDPNYCILMISPNKPRKFVVVGTFEEAKLTMANAREKDHFVEFLVFEHVDILANGSGGDIVKGLTKAA